MNFFLAKASQFHGCTGAMRCEIDEPRDIPEAFSAFSIGLFLAGLGSLTERMRRARKTTDEAISLAEISRACCLSVAMKAWRANLAQEPNKNRKELNMSDRRELCRSPNGDTWFLAREPADGRAFIIHQPNAPSGGRLSHIELAAFLSNNAHGPEHQALLRLIGTLVEVPPYAEQTSGLSDMTAVRPYDDE
ncbi:hypothetical protein M2323_004490 [Rhodoblastus acidophilus]|uniref:hypothetical protein n=1 Tax=Rhodoblastus acidophilus TaxID=1074 RepID=UPI002224E337|nr:hypothetical protein [Rhodoblastus acidophilus]MCW2286721.1 hypothetical protein [Rhodoblastus acidophilus]MCW2335541.1 hypothetical protein [Rhodoblastus acidophilus]